MITGVHTMFYAKEADAVRAFLRDKLGFAATDVGGGWLIFDLPPAEMGIHPTNFEGSPANGTRDISFVCDDIHATIAELKEKDVPVLGEPQDVGYGLAVRIKAPGDLTIEVYQPKYAK